MKLTPKIQKAIIRAAVLHSGQKRKADGLPYIIHPYSTAFILTNYIDDEDIITAGLLHDTLEDVSGYKENDLKQEFGERVLDIVRQVSEDKDPDDSKKKAKATWQARKQKYISHLESASVEAMMVCAADKIQNLTSLTEAFKQQGKDLFKKFNAPPDRKLWFYKEVLDILKQKLDNKIVSDLEKVYLKTEKLIKL